MKKEARAALAELERGGWTCRDVGPHYVCTHPDARGNLLIGGRTIGWDRREMRHAAAKALGGKYVPDRERAAARAAERERRAATRRRREIEDAARAAERKRARDAAAALDVAEIERRAPVIAGHRIDGHAVIRMSERGITPRQVADALADPAPAETHGKRVYRGPDGTAVYVVGRRVVTVA